MNATIDPNRFHLMVSIAGIFRRELAHPLVQCTFDFSFVAFPQFTSDPVSDSTLGSLELLEQRINGCFGDGRRRLKWLSLFRDPPDASRMSITTFVSQ